MNQKYTYVISKKEGQIRSFLFDADQKAVEVRVDSEQADLQTGDLFSARVQRIVPSLKAAFIDYAPGRSGYLPLETCEHPFLIHKGGSSSLQQGDELLVQVKKISPGKKQPSFTARLSIAGNFTVLQSPDLKPGVSQKIDADARSRWKKTAEALSNDTYSVLIRTNAEAAEESEVCREAEDLAEKLEKVCRKAMHLPCPSLLLGGEKRWLTRLRELPIEETEKIRIDDRDLFEEASSYLKNVQPRLIPALSFYEDPMLPMDKLYSLDRHLGEAMDRKVWLSSGAFLVIEQTEALVSIDVNTGKAAGPGNRKDREKQFLATNLEAAGEIARQLRLRNLSGVIMIDFINMKEEADRQILLNAFRQKLHGDPVRCSCIEYTKLGLVEMTRMRKERSLAESFREISLHS